MLPTRTVRLRNDKGRGPSEERRGSGSRAVYERRLGGEFRVSGRHSPDEDVFGLSGTGGLKDERVGPRQSRRVGSVDTCVRRL